MLVQLVVFAFLLVIPYLAAYQTGGMWIREAGTHRNGHFLHMRNLLNVGYKVTLFYKLSQSVVLSKRCTHSCTCTPAMEF